MATNNRISELSGIASRQDLLQASKAIADQLREEMIQHLDVAGSELGLKLGKMLDARFDKALGEVFVKQLEGVFNKHLQALEKAYQQKIDFLEKTCQEELQRVEKLLQSLQIVVQVPEQKPPDVIVNIPNKAIQVNIPEQPQPVINVAVPEINIPEIRLPEIKVEMPPARTIRKRISYDQLGRPEIIEEGESSGPSDAATSAGTAGQGIDGP